MRKAIYVGFIVALALVISLTAWNLARADEIVYQAAIAGQGVWFDDNAKPSDFEAGAVGSASLSPHISGVGSALFGFDHSYIVGNAGLRYTVTDAQNPNFSVGIGIERQFCSEPSLRPEEWLGKVVLGWRPVPETSPRLSLNASAMRGFDTNSAALTAGIRYVFTKQY